MYWGRRAQRKLLSCLVLLRVRRAATRSSGDHLPPASKPAPILMELQNNVRTVECTAGVRASPGPPSGGRAEWCAVPPLRGEQGERGGRAALAPSPARPKVARRGHAKAQTIDGPQWTWRVASTVVDAHAAIPLAHWLRHGRCRAQAHPRSAAGASSAAFGAANEALNSRAL
jgi:hypothetical protein